jgi:hypothetical protein
MKCVHEKYRDSNLSSKVTRSACFDYFRFLNCTFVHFQVATSNWHVLGAKSAGVGLVRTQPADRNLRQSAQGPAHQHYRTRCNVDGLSAVALVHVAATEGANARAQSKVQALERKKQQQHLDKAQRAAEEID